MLRVRRYVMRLRLISANRPVDIRQGAGGMPAACVRVSSYYTLAWHEGRGKARTRETGIIAGSSVLEASRRVSRVVRNSLITSGGGRSSGEGNLIKC